jgi:hypothetical protein
MAGMSIANINVANAQNPAGKSGPVSSPSNLNKGSDTGKPSQSGSESKAATHGHMKRASITGKSRYCMSGARGSNSWNCKFASMASCEKAAKSTGRHCRTNPRMASSGMKSSTTGMKSGGMKSESKSKMK